MSGDSKAPNSTITEHFFYVLFLLSFHFRSPSMGHAYVGESGGGKRPGNHFRKKESFKWLVKEKIPIFTTHKFIEEAMWIDMHNLMEETREKYGLSYERFYMDNRQCKSHREGRMPQLHKKHHMIDVANVKNEVGGKSETFLDHIDYMARLMSKELIPLELPIAKTCKAVEKLILPSLVSRKPVEEIIFPSFVPHKPVEEIIFPSSKLYNL